MVLAKGKKRSSFFPFAVFVFLFEKAGPARKFFSFARLIGPLNPRRWTMTLDFNTASHVGRKRAVNEDGCFARRQNDGALLLAVADGMGGAPGGAHASALAVAAFAATGAGDRVFPHDLPRLAMAGHTAILDHVASDPGMKGMGTTLTAALVRKEELSWVHIGDSRLYRLRKTKLRQLTSDHRFIHTLFKDDGPSPEILRRHPLRNMLDQCLGGPRIELELGNESFFPGDCLLLCTDGLSDEVTEDRIATILGKDATPAEKTGWLLKAALDAGGSDNVTVIVVG